MAVAVSSSSSSLLVCQLLRGGRAAGGAGAATALCRCCWRFLSWSNAPPAPPTVPLSQCAGGCDGAALPVVIVVGGFLPGASAMATAIPSSSSSSLLVCHLLRSDLTGRCDDDAGSVVEDDAAAPRRSGGLSRGWHCARSRARSNPRSRRASAGRWCVEEGRPELAAEREGEADEHASEGARVTGFLLVTAYTSPLESEPAPESGSSVGSESDSDMNVAKLSCLAPRDMALFPAQAGRRLRQHPHSHRAPWGHKEG